MNSNQFYHGWTRIHTDTERWIRKIGRKEAGKIQPRQGSGKDVEQERTVGTEGDVRNYGEVLFEAR
jgi:hypothetical protein